MQLSTLLLLYALQAEESYSVIDLASIDFSIIDHADAIEPQKQNSAKRFLYATGFFPEDERWSFCQNIKELPLTEQYLFTFKPKESNHGLVSFACLLLEFFVIFKDPLDSEAYMVWSMGAYQALLGFKYKEHTKMSSLKLGPINIEQINDGMYELKRAIAFDFPGKKKINTFHGLKASPIWCILHDFLHLEIISSIPDVLFETLLNAISRARQLTGFRWSKEIWKCLDMEVYHSKPNNNLSLFIELLDACQFTTQEKLGLFTISPFNDTFWILVIDMVFHPEHYKTLASELITTEPVSQYANHVQSLKNELKSLTIAQQVAYVKGRFLHLEVDHLSAKFVKDQKNYLQVQVNGNPISLSKEDFLKFTNKENDKYLLSLLEKNTISMKEFFQFDALGLNRCLNMQLITLEEARHIPDHIIPFFKNDVCRRWLEASITYQELIKYEKAFVSLLESESDKIEELIYFNIATIQQLSLIPIQTLQRIITDGPFYQKVANKQLTVEELAEQLRIRTANKYSFLRAADQPITDTDSSTNITTGFPRINRGT